jgi:membrane complex biogenesis BtpA family protein
MDRADVVGRLFSVPRALIGVVHVGALPGTPGAREGVDAIVERAAEEARLYHAHGFHGVAIENMHDRPYLKGAVGPEIVAAMTAVGREVRRAMPLPLGVQVLAGANLEAMAVAAACGAAFIRAEGFVFAHVADEGIIESSAGRLLRYRRAIGADGVRVFADIKKKHAAHALTADVDLLETAHAAELFLVDGVIVTGIATGRAAAPAEVRAVAKAVGVPTLVGSGITADNVGEYAAADGYIVGSWLKKGGDWTEPLDPLRLGALARAVERLPRRPA